MHTEYTRFKKKSHNLSTNIHHDVALSNLPNAVSFDPGNGLGVLADSQADFRFRGAATGDQGTEILKHEQRFTRFKPFVFRLNKRTGEKKNGMTDSPFLDKAADDAQGIVQRTLSFLQHQLVRAADHDRHGAGIRRNAGDLRDTNTNDHTFHFFTQTLWTSDTKMVDFWLTTHLVTIRFFIQLNSSLLKGVESKQKVEPKIHTFCEISKVLSTITPRLNYKYNIQWKFILLRLQFHRNLSQQQLTLDNQLQNGWEKSLKSEQ